MTNFDKMYSLLVEKGMDKKIAKLFIKKYKIEEGYYKCSEDTRKWAMERGFFPSRVEVFGLNDDNYKYYLPDYVDFRLHPYNNHFVIWINDKLSLKYTLGRDFADIMPEYYLYIENNGEYTYLQDTPASIAKDKDYILNLLKEKKVLIIKPNSSTSGGEGVMKVEWLNDLQQFDNQKFELVGGRVRINNKELISEAEFQERIKNLGNNIVTEYANNHSELKKIWSKSECTLRIVMIKLPKTDPYLKAKWKCIVSYARFGTSLSGGTSNLSSGGVGIGFDFQNGRLKPFGIRKQEFCPDGQWKYSEHPDTHIIWKDTCLPNWDYVRDTLYKVCDHYSSLSHLGFDVIITEKGFVLCEINSKPGMDYEQVVCDPPLLPKENIEYYNSKGMGRINCSEFYEIFKQSQE